MKRNLTIKIRANEYEKALLSLLVKKANETSEFSVLTESDVVRIAINEMATKYVKPYEIKQLRDSYGLE